jgi:hypothetical protein
MEKNPYLKYVEKEDLSSAAPSRGKMTGRVHRFTSPYRIHFWVSLQEAFLKA